MSLILLITNIPTPYRLPLFEAISSGLKRRGHELFVLFGSEAAYDRRWRVDARRYDFAFDFAGGLELRLPGTGDQTFSYRGLLRRVASLEPALVITNGFGPSTFKLWLHSFTNPRRYVIWSGAVADGPGWLGRARRRLRRTMVRRAEGCIAYGSAAKQYLIDLGQSPASIRIALNTVDTDFFTRNRTVRGERLFTFIAVGDLKHGKRLDLVLAAVGKLHTRAFDFRLEIVGDGPMRKGLEAMSKRLGLDRVVQFRGFLDQNLTRESLTHADCLLFASEFDIWGLVLNEAMAMELPVISSVKAGATIDLVDDGRTGFAVDFEDSGAVADRMEWFLRHPDEARAMGVRAREQLLAKASLAVSSAAWVEAICAFCAQDASNQ